MGFISRVKRNFIIFTSVLLVLVIFNSAVALIEGDAWRVGTSSKKLEMMENTDTWNGENIRDVMTSIDEDQLNILADGSITTEKGTAGYNQYINFEDKNHEGGFVKFLEDDKNVTGDFLYFKSGSQIARYSLEFKTSFQSDVEDSSGTRTTTGLYLGDFEDEKITILGKEYTIVKARRVTSAGNSVELTLMGGAIKDTLAEGETKTYMINEKDYEVTPLVIIDTGTICATFNINNQSTGCLKEGWSSTQAGVEILVSDLIPNEAGDVTQDLVQFYLGKPKIYLKDTNIKDMASSNALEYGTEKIDDVYVIITGSDDNSTFSIDTIQLNITADDDYYVASGHKLTEYMDEPQAFLESWDIRYGGLDPSVETETYRIKTAGSNTYKLEFVDGDGNIAQFPILYTDDSNIRFGDNNDDLVLKGSMKIQKNDYLIVSDYSKEDGRRTTYALRYKGANKVASGETAIVKFDNLGTGKRINQTYTPNEEGMPSATLKLGGATFDVINASDDTVDDFDVWVDLDADGVIQDDNDIVSINTNAGMKIELNNETDYISTIFSTPNKDDYDNVAPTPVKLKLSAFNRSVYFEETDDSNIDWVSPSEEPTISYAYTSMGAKFKWENSPWDPDLLTIEYPKEQRLPLIYIVGGSYEIPSDTTPLIITINNPIDGSTITTDSIWLNVTTNEPTYCWINDLYKYPTDDKTPPLIYGVNPSGIFDACCGYELSFKTNEEATCKGNANIDTTYENMSFTFNSREISLTEYTHTYHTNLWGNNTIFVKCKDLAGNINPISYNWSFEQICSNPRACGGGGGGAASRKMNYTNQHQWQYTNLTNKYTYVIEVKCKDKAYNSNTNSVIFNVNFPDFDNDGIINNKDNCPLIYNPNQMDTNGNGVGNVCENDFDGDGVNNNEDKITGNISYVNNNFNNLSLIIKNDSIEIKEGNITILSFPFNQSGNNTLYIPNITIEKQTSNDSGSLLIKGITLEGDQTKSVLVDNLNPSVNTICIHDSKIASITEISSACNGNNETLVTCNSNLQNGYICTDLGSKYNVTGLHYTGVKEQAPSSSDNGGPTGGGGGGGGAVERACVESWTCTDWTPTICPATRQQTRTCIDKNNCRTTINKPNEIRTCFYYIPPEERVEVIEEAKEETPPTVAPPEETPPKSTPGMLAITGAVIGATYRERPLTMGILTLFILLMIGVFIYSHAKNLAYWPFHFKFPKKRWIVLVITVLIIFVLLFIHLVLLVYFKGIK